MTEVKQYTLSDYRNLRGTEPKSSYVTMIANDIYNLLAKKGAGSLDITDTDQGVLLSFKLQGNDFEILIKNK